MGTTHFSGPVVVAGGFTGDLTGDVTGDILATAPAAAEHGAGAIGTAFAPKTTRREENGTIITEIKFDLTGLGCVGTAGNDVIGLVAGGVAFLGKYDTALCGIVYKAELSCIEVPAGSATITGNIDIATNASAVLEYDGAAGSAKLIDGGTLIAGQTLENLVPAMTADDYLYIVEADTEGSTGVYSAGQFILKMFGHALMP